MDTTQAKEIIEPFTNSFPVKVGSIANALGLNVYLTNDLPPNTSGSIVHEKDGNYSIYVKEGQSPQRQRFTIAHEIGHFVEHGDELNPGQEIISPLTKKPPVLHRKEKEAISVDDKSKEKEADDFAANLLMPEVEFKKVWDKANTLSEVASYFGVSQMAANIRGIILKLGYFDESITE